MSTPETPPPAASLVPKTLLGVLAAILQSEDYNVVHAPAGKSRDVEEVVVNAGEVKDQLVPFRITILNSIIGVPDAAAGGIAPVGILMYHGSAVLPFQISPERTADIMQAAFLLNRMLPLCSFGVDAQTGSCYVTAVMTSESAEYVPVDTALETVQMVCHAVSTYGPALASLAEGATTLADFTAGLVSAGADFPPIEVPRRLVGP